MERFSSKLKNRRVVLSSREDAVRFSFIVKTSLSYLNLQLLEYSNLNRPYRRIIDVANDFVCTEEKCRKIFTYSRSLLYNLNLDMPTRREYKLQNDMDASRFDWNYDIPHIAKITFRPEFHLRNMLPLIADALKVPDNKLRILRFLVKSPVIKDEVLCRLGSHFMNEFIDCFYPQITDSELFKSFVDISDFLKWMSAYEKPEILEYLLYHARRQGKDLEKDGYSMCEVMDNCILNSKFSNIKSILKYTDAPKFSFDICFNYLQVISFRRERLFRSLLSKFKLLKPQRLHMILQIFCIYIGSSRLGCTETGSEALRLLWSSCPAACITHGEIEEAFKGTFTDEELTSMYEFYHTSIGEEHSVVETRLLKHLCRTSIRKILKKNIWIPEGVELTGLPKPLQSYLNLEKICSFQT